MITMTAQMTSKERMAALWRQEPLDRVPFALKGYSFCAANTGLPVADIYENPEASYWAQTHTMQQYGADVNPFYTFVSYGAWEFGGEIAWPDDRWASGPSVARRPVQKPEDIFKLELPDVRTAGCIPRMMEFARLQEQHGTQIAFVFGSPFTFAANLCGVEDFLTWTMTDRAAVEHALRLMAEHLKQVADYFIDTFGAERVLPRSASPTDGLLSPPMYQELVLPVLQDLHQHVLNRGVRHIYGHICGDQNHLLELIGRIPWGEPGMLSFGHEVDLLQAAEKIPGHILCGNLEPAFIVQGQPEPIYEAARENIEKGRQIQHGFVFTPGCSIGGDTPPYHMYLLGKACEDFGSYT